jgi:hypothetical protein
VGTYVSVSHSSIQAAVVALTVVTLMQESTRSFLKSSGVDVDTVSKTADTASKGLSDAATVATPTVSKLVNFLTTADAATLGRVGVATVLIYYLTPVAIKSAFSSLRGFAGMFYILRRTASKALRPKRAHPKCPCHLEVHVPGECDVAEHCLASPTSQTWRI